MKKFGYIRIMAYVPEVKVADIDYNVSRIKKGIEKAEKENVDIVVFPELCITGYTCGDLFSQSLILEKAKRALISIRESMKNSKVMAAIGAPIFWKGRVYNCAVILAGGHIKGIVPKTHIPNYGEFDEKRWFSSGKDIVGQSISIDGEEVSFSTNSCFVFKGVKIGVEICEDLWVPIPPSERLVEEGADVILNLSASNAVIGKRDYIRNLVKMQSGKCRCVYAYASAGPGESSSDLVFPGIAMVSVDGSIIESVDEIGDSPIFVIRDIDIEKLRLDRIKYNTFYDEGKQGFPASSDQFISINCNDDVTTDAESSFFDNDVLNEDNLNPEVKKYPFIPEGNENLSKRCRDIINIQVSGLITRLKAIGCKKAVIGISGGLDSTLALLVTIKAFDVMRIDRRGIFGITMPGLATSKRTKSNAMSLMDLLGVSIKEIPIKDAVDIHFRDIGQNPEVYDVTFENSQARERTQILMDIANKENAIVIGTGDMSELALGWCTYNGDQMSMYGVNAGVPKTLVRHLVRWFAEEEKGKIKNILLDIIDTPISPELVPSSENEPIGQ